MLIISGLSGFFQSVLAYRSAQLGRCLFRRFFGPVLSSDTEFMLFFLPRTELTMKISPKSLAKCMDAGFIKIAECPMCCSALINFLP